MATKKLIGTVGFEPNVCPVCKKNFFSTPDWVYRTTKGEKVCSYKCANKANRKPPSKEEEDAKVIREKLNIKDIETNDAKEERKRIKKEIVYILTQISPLPSLVLKNVINTDTYTYQACVQQLRKDKTIETVPNGKRFSTYQLTDEYREQISAN